ncbi:cytochrome C oxidase subunit IV family protein [Bacteriovoracaceae bacterium]|nr:cytochrome C oxidase subunit IV family protein [Bacteriovoracaceae bacterium]
MSSDHAEGGHMDVKQYVYLWVVLLVLLIGSLFAGHLGSPLMEKIIIWGVAIIKTLIVAAYYMHLKMEKKFIKWSFYFGICCVVFFVAGTYVDVVMRTN